MTSVPPNQTNAFRGRIVYPKDPRVKGETALVFADQGTEAALAAEKAAAQLRESGSSMRLITGGNEMISETASGRVPPFTRVLCTSALLPSLSRTLARTLGPKGLMPSVKRGTVVEDGEEMQRAIEQLLSGVDWRGDRLGVVRGAVGRISFTDAELRANVQALLDSVIARAAGGLAGTKVSAKVVAGYARDLTREDTDGKPLMYRGPSPLKRGELPLLTQRSPLCSRCTSARRRGPAYACASTMSCRENRASTSHRPPRCVCFRRAGCSPQSRPACCSALLPLACRSTTTTISWSWGSAKPTFISAPLATRTTATPAPRSWGTMCRAIWAGRIPSRRSCIRSRMCSLCTRSVCGFAYTAFAFAVVAAFSSLLAVTCKTMMNALAIFFATVGAIVATLAFAMVIAIYFALKDVFDGVNVDIKFGQSFYFTVIGAACLYFATALMSGGLCCDPLFSRHRRSSPAATSYSAAPTTAPPTEYHATQMDLPAFPEYHPSQDESVYEMDETMDTLSKRPMHAYEDAVPAPAPATHVAYSGAPYLVAQPAESSTRLLTADESYLPSHPSVSSQMPTEHAYVDAPEAPSSMVPHPLSAQQADAWFLNSGTGASQAAPPQYPPCARQHRLCG